MARPKSAKNVPIKYWLSAKKDCKEGRFMQVGNSLMLFEHFQKLKATTRFLYLAMCMEAAQKPTFKFPASAALKYGIPKSTFERAKRELQEAGFIKEINNDELSQYKACEFKFITDWKSKSAPQNGTL